MAQVAVVHNTLDFQGGADAVCLSTCEALLTDHDVTLFTLSETAVSELAERFDTEVADLGVRTPPANSWIAKTLTRLGPRIGPQLAFRSVLVSEFFKRHAAGFDLSVCTANEMSLPKPSVQYVHDPQYHRQRLENSDPGRLNRFWSVVEAPDQDDLRNTKMLANSSWTADRVEQIYDVRPAVLHPPVDPINCGRAWEDREAGIVLVGRVAPDKNMRAAIRILDRLRDRGHAVHLHIVGSAPQSYRPYVDQVADAAAQRTYVDFERDVSRNRLEELLCSHRYGLNLKWNEHFGMSVAEYVAAGMIAFAPDKGGQRAILNERPDRLFDSIDGAVDRIETSIETDDRPSLSRDRFGRDRFNSAINRIANQVLLQ